MPVTSLIIAYVLAAPTSALCGWKGGILSSLLSRTTDHYSSMPSQCVKVQSLKIRDLLTSGKHLDGKNMPGSYSCLMIFETGIAPVAGAFYLLPQYHKALDMRQGAVSSNQSYQASVKICLGSAVHVVHQHVECLTWPVRLLAMQLECAGHTKG